VALDGLYMPIRQSNTFDWTNTAKGEVYKL